MKLTHLRSFIFVFTVVSSALFSNKASGAAVLGQGIFPPLQFPARDGTVWGMRLSPGFAEHKEMIGLDLAWVGHTTTSRFIGTSISGIYNSTAGSAIVFPWQFAGIFNRNSGTATIVGMQFAAGANLNGGKTMILGFQAALLANNNAGPTDLFGIQFAATNLDMNTNVLGIQAGLYTRAAEVRGLQTGLYCRATKVVGFQVCWVSDTDTLYGVQLGLINIARKGPIRFFPLINIGF